MDRRAVFFVIAAVVSLALVPAIPHESGKPDITWVGWAMVSIYVLLAVLSWLDHRSRHRERP